MFELFVLAGPDLGRRRVMGAPEVTLRIPELELYEPHPPGCRRYNLEIPFPHAWSIFRYILRIEDPHVYEQRLPLLSLSPAAVFAALDRFPAGANVPGLDDLDVEIYLAELRRFADLAFRHGLSLTLG